VKGFEAPLLGQYFNLIYVLVTSVIPFARKTFAVLIMQAGAKTLENTARGEILAGYELEAQSLPLFFQRNELVKFRVEDLEVLF
jgi:hypothetical protein